MKFSIHFYRIYLHSASSSRETLIGTKALKFVEKTGYNSLLVEKIRNKSIELSIFGFIVGFHAIEESEKSIWPGYLFSSRKVPIGSK